VVRLPATPGPFGSRPRRETRARFCDSEAMVARNVGYARCTPARPDLAGQRRALESLGVDPADVFVDVGLRGRSRRPGLHQALARTGPGDTLAVTALHRLARSTADARAIVERLAEVGAHLRIGARVLDLHDVAGRAFRDSLALVAGFEADLARARTREGMAVARAHGHLRGRRPKLSPAQERRLLEVYRTGVHSSTEIAELFSVSRATVYRAVRRAAGAETARC
jgi:DNA invertase Pin-like site-specific DNA recombinase